MGFKFTPKIMRNEIYNVLTGHLMILFLIKKQDSMINVFP